MLRWWSWSPSHPANCDVGLSGTNSTFLGVGGGVQTYVPYRTGPCPAGECCGGHGVQPVSCFAGCAIANTESLRASFFQNGTQQDPDYVLPSTVDLNGDPVADDWVRSDSLFHREFQPQLAPAKFPISACDSISEHDVCVATSGCGWLRTIVRDGICREDPVHRCLTEPGATGGPDCQCSASDFDGDAAHDTDIELFLPLSIDWTNLAQSTLSRYHTRIDMQPVANEATSNFTSRTDFTYKTLTVHFNPTTAAAGWTEPHGAPEVITAGGGLSLTLKLMHVWDMQPETINGDLFVGLGMRVELLDDAVRISTFAGTDAAGSPVFTASSAPSIPVSSYHCDQLAIVVSNVGATVQLGTNPGTVVSISELTMATVSSYAALNTTNNADLFRIGPVNAKVWDVRLYGNPKPPAVVGDWWPGREVRAPPAISL